jgi:hypothetical protein
VSRGRASWRSGGVAVVLTALPVAALLAAAPVAAQTPALGGGVVLQTFTFQDAEQAGLGEVALFAAPFGAMLPLGSRFAVQVSGAWAEATVTAPDDSEATLSGLVDTDLDVALALVPDRVVVTGGFSIPTGDATQTIGEVGVAGVMASELLPFAVTSWGTGGSAGGELALAFQAGAWGVGMSGGYRSALSYEPLADQPFSYRPGAELRARLSLDRDVGESGTLSLLAGWQRFGEDAMAARNLFRPGDRIAGLASYAVALGGSSSGLFYASASRRQNGTVLAETPDLEGATDSPAQTLFQAGATFRVPRARVSFLPEVELRAFRSDDGVGQGWLAGAGAGLELRLAGRRSGAQVLLAPSARVRAGHVVVSEGSESGLAGWEAGVTLRFEDVR